MFASAKPLDLIMTVALSIPGISYAAGVVFFTHTCCQNVGSAIGSAAVHSYLSSKRAGFSNLFRGISAMWIAEIKYVFRINESTN